jgi:hypothetical protein
MMHLLALLLQVSIFKSPATHIQESHKLTLKQYDLHIQSKWNVQATKSKRII